METKETLKQKAFRLWNAAGLPEFLNKYRPKITPGWMTFLAHLEHAEHAPNWRGTASFMNEHYAMERQFSTWQNAISKWPQWVWDALGEASAGDEPVKTAAIDGTTFSRSNPSQHYMKKILGGKFARPIQGVLMVNVEKRKFLSWRIRARPRGEKCDVPYLIRHSPVYPELVLMDKGFDSQPLHEWLRNEGIWSVAPVRKGCKRGRYRKQLRDCFDHSLYWQRNIVESMISAVKKRYGSHIRARTARMARAELFIKFIAYNLSVILTHDFLQSLSKNQYLNLSLYLLIMRDTYSR